MTKIGEGAYGCVYIPPLTCKNKLPNKYYTGKISKATSLSNAIKEIEKQSYIDNEIDPNFKYHIPPPFKCSPDLSIKSSVKLLKNCNALKKNNGRKNEIIPFDEISLLIIKNGGLDLKKFVNYFLLTNDIKKPVNTSFSNLNGNYESEVKTKIMINFWSESIILIDALVDFAKNKTLHHDLKPENIVYDHIQNRFNIIDFGLVRKYEDYHSDIAHYSYPPETYVLNPTVHTFVSKASNKDFKYVLGIDPVNEYTPFMDSYKYFLSYITADNYSPFEIRHPFYAYRLKYGFKTEKDILSVFDDNLYKGKTLNEIKYQSMITDDMYGMGLALMYVFVRTFFYLKKSNGSLNGNFIKKMYKILFSMVHPNCFKRPGLNDLKENYEETLKLLNMSHNHTRHSIKKIGRKTCKNKKKDN